MIYKLGSQIDIYDNVEDGQSKFEWNICMMANEYSEPEQHLYIGTRTAHDPIVKKARELVKLLNEEK